MVNYKIQKKKKPNQFLVFSTGNRGFDFGFQKKSVLFLYKKKQKPFLKKSAFAVTVSKQTQY